MRLLVLGGTAFIGRHIVEAALGRGHVVTVFHRGRTNAHLWREVEHRFGDRDGDLVALRDGTWDAVIDTSAYTPRGRRPPWRAGPRPMASFPPSRCTPTSAAVASPRRRHAPPSPTMICRR